MPVDELQKTAESESPALDLETTHVHEVDLRDPQLGVDRILEAMRGGAFGEILDFPVVNRFTPGLYAREVFVPAGSLVITKIHKTEHPFVVSKGSLSVWTEESGVVKISAPFTGITKPGTRRIAFTHEDTVWTTFHPTNETDLEKLESALICQREDLDELRASLATSQKCLGSH